MAWESTKYKLEADRLTVATSNGGDRQSQVSNASTAFYSQECQRLEAAVKECKEARIKLERDVAIER